MKYLFPIFAALVVAFVLGCAHQTSFQSMLDAQAQSQAEVNIACAGLTTLANTAPDVTHRVAANVGADCASAQATAAAISAAVASAAAANPKK